MEKKKIKCKLCGNEVDEGVKICPFCDSVLIHTCFFCDAVIKDHNKTKTCPSCGKPYIPYLKPRASRPAKKYKKEEGEQAIKDVISRAKEINKSDDHIYRITKLVVFGSVLNKRKKYIRNVNIAYYAELKDKTENEIEQSESLYLKDISKGVAKKLDDYERSWFYGYTKMYDFLRGGMEMIHLHDGKEAEEMAKFSGAANYIYIGDYNEIPLNTQPGECLFKATDEDKFMKMILSLGKILSDATDKQIGALIDDLSQEEQDMLLRDLLKKHIDLMVDVLSPEDKRSLLDDFFMN